MIVDEPGYLVNLTRLLPATPKRTLANYMMWRATRASLDYFTEAARKIQLEFAKNITGKKSGTDRWKTCTGRQSPLQRAQVGGVHFRELRKEESIIESSVRRSTLERAHVGGVHYRELR